MKTEIESKHTPGPWRIHAGPNLAGIEETFVTNGNDFICSCGNENSTMPGGLERREANARLQLPSESIEAEARQILIKAGKVIK